MSSEREYPIDVSAVTVPPGATPAELLARRDDLLRSVLRLVPGEARSEFRKALTRPTVSLLFSVWIEGVAELVAEIYAIDQAMPGHGPEHG